MQYEAWEAWASGYVRMSYTAAVVGLLAEGPCQANDVETGESREGGKDDGYMCGKCASVWSKTKTAVMVKRGRLVGCFGIK